MCGRYRLSAVERIEERFEAEQLEEALRPRYNIAPSQSVPIIRQDDGHRTLAIMRWGLVPFWAKDVSIGYKMINARSETVTRKPAFRNCFRTRRCLIPADGFYEWSKLQLVMPVRLFRKDACRSWSRPFRSRRQAGVEESDGTERGPHHVLSR
jgi:putative SOS response-associated peptidase YedK